MPALKNNTVVGAFGDASRRRFHRLCEIRHGSAGVPLLQQRLKSLAPAQPGNQKTLGFLGSNPKFGGLGLLPSLGPAWSALRETFGACVFV